MFATAAMGVVFLAPLALLALFVFMFKSNRMILSLVPLALMIVFLIFNYNEVKQVMDIIIHHSLIWIIPLVILVLLLLRSIGFLAKMVLILVGCAAGLFIQFGFLMPTEVVNPFDFRDEMTSAMIYKYGGGSVDLNNSDLADLLLSDGGRICIITFHSLEDRIVKTIFRRNENPCTCPPDFPVCVCGKKSKGKVITRKPILPSEEELENNSRSKSAKLRVFERVIE